MSEVV